MPLLGDNFRDAFDELLLEAEGRVVEFAEGVADTWLDDTRYQSAVRAPPAPRSSWAADVLNLGGGQLDIIRGWTDFTGSSEAAEARFTNAISLHDRIVDSDARDFDLLR